MCGCQEWTYKSAAIEEGTKMCCSRCYFLVTKNGTEPLRTLQEHMEEQDIEKKVLRALRRYLVATKKYITKYNTKFSTKELLDLELSTCIELHSLSREVINYKQELELYKYLVNTKLPSLFPKKLSTYELKEIQITNYGNDDYEVQLEKVKKND